MDFFESIYFVEIVGLVVATILAFLGGRQSSGTGKVLGKEYGKVNYFSGFLRWLFLGISLLLAFLLMIIFAIDFFKNFFSSSLTYVLCFAVGCALYLFVFYINLNKGQEKLEKKYEKEINAICMRNPVFKAAFDKINSNNSIKMVRVYRDGIAFFDYSYQQVSENETIAHGATSNSDAKKLLKEKAATWLMQYGNIGSSGSNEMIRYSDYGYMQSETAMNDIAKHLHRLTAPRFLFYKHEKDWNFKQVNYYSSGSYSISNGVATPIGGSSETIEAYEKVIAYITLYTKEAGSNTEVSPPLTKW